VRLVSPRELVFKERRGGRTEYLEALAQSQEPRLAKLILQALQEQGAALPITDLILALESGDVSKVVALIKGDKFDASMGKVQDGLMAIVTNAGNYAAADIAKPGVAFRFNTLNPKLITWLQTYSLGLIRQIDETTRDGIREHLITGMRAGVNPKQVAVEIKQSIGLTASQMKHVANYRKELETFHTRKSAKGYGLGTKIDRVNGTQVFKPAEDGTPKDGIDQRRLRDFRFDGQLSSAMASGKPLSPQQIEKMVAAYTRKYLAYRARNIARTEAMRATNVGVFDAWRQAVDAQVVPEAMVRKQWIVAKDERLCEVCAPIPSMNTKLGVPLKDLFKTPKGPQSLPPIHPSCRCTIFVRRYEPEQLKG
jgi:hypothetical protein